MERRELIECEIEKILYKREIRGNGIIRRKFAQLLGIRYVSHSECFRKGDERNIHRDYRQGELLVEISDIVSDKCGMRTDNVREKLLEVLEQAVPLQFKKEWSPNRKRKEESK